MFKPKRPCSIYNLFYQLEREILIHDIDPEARESQVREVVQAGQNRGKQIAIADDADQRPFRYRHLFLTSDWYKSGRTDRKHRRSTTKLKWGFKELNDKVSERWALVDDETRAYLKAISDQEWALYRVELKAYKKRQDVIVKHLSKQREDEEEAEFENENEDEGDESEEGRQENAEDLPEVKIEVRKSNSVSAARHGRRYSMPTHVGGWNCCSQVELQMEEIPSGNNLFATANNRHHHHQDLEHAVNVGTMQIHRSASMPTLIDAPNEHHKFDHLAYSRRVYTQCASATNINHQYAVHAPSSSNIDRVDPLVSTSFIGEEHEDDVATNNDDDAFPHFHPIPNRVLSQTDFSERLEAISEMDNSMHARSFCEIPSRSHFDSLREAFLASSIK